MKADAPTFAWTRSLAEWMRALETSPAGLTSAEAETRRRRVGDNRAVVGRRRPWWLDLVSRFASPLVLVLLVASAIAGILGDPKSFVIIACVVGVSVVLDFVQEHRAQNAAERLQAQVETRATVLRDGRSIELAARALVPGDVVQLSAGDLVPADARVLDAHALQAQQASLTGESYPVDKTRVEDGEANVEPGESTGTVFAGTSIVAGTGTALVVATGTATQLATTARTLASPPPPHAFELGTRRFGAMIVRFTLVLVFFVLVVNTLTGRAFLDSLLFALALAVGLTPELLPMIVSVTLARGAMRMARRAVIVKRLAAIHDLGSMDVLCTDKTGTLTEARIVVAQHVDANGDETNREVLELARAAAVLGGGVRSAIDDALAGREDVDVERFHRIDELPFDPTTRRATVLVDDGTSRRLIVKGAAEELLEACTLDDAKRAEILGRIDSLAREGMRVVGVATRSCARTTERVEPGDDRALTFVGLVAFVDPPKKNAGEALAKLRDRGVAVKIVTGDHELVARHLARELRLPCGEALAGHEIDRLDDDALAVRADRADLFHRVTPVQKRRVILALKSAGHVVGYLGDGINDGPPLHGADVGISVDGAVDVAKEAADLILSRPDLAVLGEAAMEGRRTLANVNKYVLMATSSNFGNMVSMAAASLFLPFLPMLPVQILLNNLLYDVSELAIPLDDVDDDALARPHRWDVALTRRFMLTVGPLSSLFDFLTFWALLHVLHADAATFRTGWFVESIASQIFVIFVIRTRNPAWKSRPNRWLVAAAMGAVAIAVALPFTPAASWLALVPLRAATLGLLAAIVVAYLVLVESVKRRLMPA